MSARSIVFGMGVATAARAALLRGLRMKFTRDVRKLNAGDHSSLLSAYADDFVLHFAPGDHRFAGDWVGRRGMDRFLQNFTAARIQGEIREITVSGPPWALVLWARFDDHADGPDGTRLYENRTVLVLRTRWGRIIEQEDFFLDTARIGAFDRRLRELDVPFVAREA